MATQLSASIKRPRVETKSYKFNSEKHPKTLNPIVIRSPPDAKGLDIDCVVNTLESPDPKALAQKLGPLCKTDVYSGVSDRGLIETILGVEKKKPQLVLKEENVAQLVQDCRGMFRQLVDMENR